MSDLFGCVLPEAFRIFTGRHALAAEAALLRLCATHFDEMALENPQRDQVKNSIAAAIEGLPTLPDTQTSLFATQLKLALRVDGAGARNY
jgi:hypothetical protein